jgi:hypothetical protein
VPSTYTTSVIFNAEADSFKSPQFVPSPKADPLGGLVAIVVSETPPPVTTSGGGVAIF